jgi:NADPH:quinone reductase
MTGSGSRAVRFDRYGGRDVLYVADVPLPTPAAGEVVVAVKAAAINPGEAAIRSGALAERFPASFPSGEGSDLAGLVTALGAGVNEFDVGDAVLGYS